ncbi:MAG: phosphate ABC transporter substrate-binding protein [Nitrospinaceae bacterium]
MDLKKFGLLAISTLLLTGLPGQWGMGPVPVYGETLVRVGGSTTLLPVVTRAAEEYMKAHPGVRITVSGGGSGVGIRGAATGILDIGLASRHLTSPERSRFGNAGAYTAAIGRDAIACVVSSEVFAAGVRALSRRQIQDIYLGRIRNWKQVGGPDHPIVVIDKERHRGTRHVFMQYVFGNPEARAPGVRLVTGSNNEEQTKIAQSDAAIGLLSFAWMNSDVKGVSLKTGAGLMEPLTGNVKKGRYPIVRNLDLVTLGKPEGAVRRFINFLRGPRGHTLVESGGFIPVRSAEGSRFAGAGVSR